MRHLFYISAGLVYTTIYVSRRQHIALNEWINNYVTDLLAVPIVLSIVLWLIQRIPRYNRESLSWQMVLLAWIYMSIVFESMLPLMSPRYTSDPLDVLCYLIGSVSYIIMARSSTPKHRDARYSF